MIELSGADGRHSNGVLTEEMSVFGARSGREPAKGKRTEDIDEIERFGSNGKVWSI
jgi:hypothetical protein